MATVIQSWHAGCPTLLPPREAPYILQGVYEKVVDGCRQDLILDWGVGYLVLHADEDTDSLTTQFNEEKYDSSGQFLGLESRTPWDRFLGKECGWTWLAVNQQGYWDSILISFDGIVPSVLLQVIASSIEVFTIEKHQGIK